MLRFSSLTVAQLARQCIRHMQARAMPSLAAAVNRLHEQGVEGQAEGSTVLVSMPSHILYLPGRCPERNPSYVAAVLHIMRTCAHARQRVD